jgi:hypothetical protein
MLCYIILEKTLGFILFYFILFYFILFYFILFYFIYLLLPTYGILTLFIKGVASQEL